MMLIIVLTFGNLNDLADNIETVTVSESLYADIDDCHKLILSCSGSLVVFTQTIRSIHCNINGLELLLT